ncbi:hypothetical protein [Bradyrhizobium sp. LM6.9]
MPDLVDKLVLADHPVAVLHEVDDEIEDLRLHGNGNLLAAQFAQVGIEQMIPEQKLHVEDSNLTMTSAIVKSKRISTEVCESAEGPVRFTTIA